MKKIKMNTDVDGQQVLRRTGVEKNKGITMNAATLDEIGNQFGGIGPLISAHTR
jgi:hypothetical protein